MFSKETGANVENNLHPPIWVRNIEHLNLVCKIYLNIQNSLVQAGPALYLYSHERDIVHKWPIRCQENARVDANQTPTFGYLYSPILIRPIGANNHLYKIQINIDKYIIWRVGAIILYIYIYRPNILVCK